MHIYSKWLSKKQSIGNTVRFRQYDKIEEFNVDSKAECDQLNLTHETKTNASAHLVQ